MTDPIRDAAKEVMKKVNETIDKEGGGPAEKPPESKKEPKDSQPMVIGALVVIIVLLLLTILTTHTPQQQAAVPAALPQIATPVAPAQVSNAHHCPVNTVFDATNGFCICIPGTPGCKVPVTETTDLPNWTDADSKELGDLLKRRCEATGSDC